MFLPPLLFITWLTFCSNTWLLDAGRCLPKLQLTLLLALNHSFSSVDWTVSSKQQVAYGLAFCCQNSIPDAWERGDTCKRHREQEVTEYTLADLRDTL